MSKLASVMPLPGRVNTLQREFVSLTAHMRKTGLSQVEMQAAEPQLKCHKRACEQRTEITHFLCFKGVNVGDVVNFMSAIGRFALQFFATGERCGARKTGIIATNGVWERRAGVLSGSVSVTDIQTRLQRAWCNRGDAREAIGERQKGSSCVRGAEMHTTRPAPVELLMQVWEGAHEMPLPHFCAFGAMFGRARAPHNRASKQVKMSIFI